MNRTYACTGGPHIQPGSTVFTRIRSGPSSRASAYIALVSAPFEAAYAACPTCEGAATADCVPMNTTDPPPARPQRRQAQARVIRSVPSRFTSRTACQVVKSASASPPKYVSKAATCTTASIPPNRSRASAASASHCPLVGDVGRPVRRACAVRIDVRRASGEIRLRTGAQDGVPAVPHHGGGDPVAEPGADPGDDDGPAREQRHGGLPYEPWRFV